jgi:hypothetical protein
VTRNRWSVLAAVVVGFAAGCSKTSDLEAARSRAEVESLRAELGRLQAQHNELRAEVVLLRTVRPTPLAGQPRPKAKGDVAARFEAASALTNPSERQRVYTTVVLDAATIGDADTVKKCLENITNPSSRQEATYRSALRLAAAGKTADGITLAKSLTNPSQREKALSKIAREDHEE